MDFVASSLISTYDVDKAQNSLLESPLFHNPASCFSQNGRGTMGKIAKQKNVMTDSFRIYGGIFCQFLV